MSKAKKHEDKVEFDSSNEQLMGKLKKHLVDWFEGHQNEEFIKPRAFQNLYPLFDKYTSESFRRHFYNIRKKILSGKIDLSRILFNYSFIFISYSDNYLQIQK